MRRSLRVLLVVLYGVVLPYLSACSPSMQEPITHFELQAPKPFGYVIGDEIHHRIIVGARPGISLSKDSIPSVGALNRWLHLKAAKVSVRAEGDADKIVLELTYQVFYSPLEVKMLKIPGFTMRFQQYGKSIEQPVPEWHFTLSPLHELAIRKDEGQVYLRPDATPDIIKVQPVLMRAYLSLIALFLSVLYLVYRHGLLPWQRGRSVFNQASWELARLSINDFDKALTVIHHALNTTNDNPLFKQDLPTFYQRNPQFKTIAAELDWFFNFSSLYFFANRHYVAEQDFIRLQQLCKRCRKLELAAL